jgi:lysophospholipase L1-like esterase
MAPAMLLLLVLLQHAGLTAAPDTGQRQQLCVLPIGDSITQGAINHATWRPSLWRQLLDSRPAATEVLYTGGMVNQWGAPVGTTQSEPAYAGHPFPQNHEGHFGWTSAQILAGRPLVLGPDPETGRPSGDGSNGHGGLDDWMELYSDICTPSCVLVHLGTNDICMGGPGVAPSVVVNLREIVRRVAARFGSDTSPLTALVAAPIPSCCSDVASAMAPAVRAAFEADSNFGLDPRDVNVKLVEMTEGYEWAWNYDTCHPDERGEEFMAARWFEQIQAHCPDVTATVNVNARAGAGETFYGERGVAMSAGRPRAVLQPAALVLLLAAAAVALRQI